MDGIWRNGWEVDREKFDFFDVFLLLNDFVDVTGFIEGTNTQKNSMIFKNFDPFLFFNILFEIFSKRLTHVETLLDNTLG